MERNDYFFSFSFFFSKKRKCVEGTGMYNPLLSKERLEGAADAAGKGF